MDQKVIIYRYCSLQTPFVCLHHITSHNRPSLTKFLSPPFRSLGHSNKHVADVRHERRPPSGLTSSLLTTSVLQAHDSKESPEFLLFARTHANCKKSPPSLTELFICAQWVCIPIPIDEVQDKAAVCSDIFLVISRI